MSDKVKFEVLNSLLARVQSAARAPSKSFTVTLPSRTHEAEEALMLTYIAKLEFVARRCRSLGPDHTSDLDAWLEQHPGLPFVSLPAR